MICQPLEERRSPSQVGRPRPATARRVNPSTDASHVSAGAQYSRHRATGGVGEAQADRNAGQVCDDLSKSAAGGRDLDHMPFRRRTNSETLTEDRPGSNPNPQRAINQARLQTILELPLDFIPNQQFLETDAERWILAEPPGPIAATGPQKVPSGLPPYLASLYEVPLLTREQEVHLFRQFNFLKYKASKLRSQLGSDGADQLLLDEIERLYGAAMAVRNRILQANLRLVVSIAKRYVGRDGDLWGLISDGNVSLIKAVDKFDFARGNKVSTYATWAIMRNFARTIPTEQRHHDRFRTSQLETLNTSQERRADPQEQETSQRQRVTQVQRILRWLDSREQKVVIGRFGLLSGQKPRTLEEIGVEMGVSKERIRQIQTRAMQKLRIAAEKEHLELSCGG